MTHKIVASTFLFGLVSLFYSTVVSAQNAKDWYPLEPGDAWIYQKEALDGSMDHPNVERWTTEDEDNECGCRA